MIIGFLGKGGSGKTTMATGFARFLAHNPDNHVLAIDADHNIDFAYNLGAPMTMPYFGDSLEDIKQYLAVNNQNALKAMLGKTPEYPYFTIHPQDSYTQKYSYPLSDNLSLMAAGPLTDAIKFDMSCSHVLFSSLKYYLPLLNVKDNQYAVVDEKAGTDGVSSGISTGFSAAVIVVEPRPHSIKVAIDIASMLHFFETPYIFVGNKIEHDEHAELIKDSLELVTYFGINSQWNKGIFTDAQELEKFETIYKKLEEVKTPESERLYSTRKKIQRNEKYKDDTKK